MTAPEPGQTAIGALKARAESAEARVARLEAETGECVRFFAAVLSSGALHGKEAPFQGDRDYLLSEAKRLMTKMTTPLSDAPPPQGEQQAANERLNRAFDGLDREREEMARAPLPPMPDEDGAVAAATARVVSAAKAMTAEVGHRGAWLSVPCLRAVCDSVDALLAAEAQKGLDAEPGA